MKILAKSAPVGYEINDKVSKGCDGIEIQLLVDFLKEDVPARQFFDEIIKVNNMDVCVVHMPLLNGENVNLELFTYPIYGNAFLKAAELCQLLADYYGHKIVMIIHNGFTLEQYLHMPVLFGCVINNYLKNSIENYKDIEYAFENILPIVLSKNRFPLTRNGFAFDNVDLAIYLNKIFDTNVFGTVIDTCHYIVSEKIVKSVFAEDYPDVLNDFCLEEFFRRNNGFVKVFHLANVISLGFDKNQHGCGFDENVEDIEFLNRFFELYYKYADNAFVTLEVYEKDYSDSQNYLLTKHIVDRYKK